MSPVPHDSLHSSHPELMHCNSLIAIMLGRLHMSAADCEEAYRSLSEAILKPKGHDLNGVDSVLDFLRADSKFDATALEDAKLIVKRD